MARCEGDWEVYLTNEGQQTVIVYRGDEHCCRSVYDDYAELIDMPRSEFKKALISLMCGDVEVESHRSGA